MECLSIFAQSLQINCNSDGERNTNFREIVDPCLAAAQGSSGGNMAAAQGLDWPASDTIEQHDSGLSDPAPRSPPKCSYDQSSTPLTLMEQLHQMISQRLSSLAICSPGEPNSCGVS